MKNIIWVQPDQTIAVTSIFDDVDSQEYAAQLKGQGDIPADFEAVGFDIYIPDTGWSHESHRWDGENVVVDFSAAQDETRSRLRAERESLFEANDLALRDAMLANDSEALCKETAERDRLRELLRIEYMRHNRLISPWDCVETDCPYLGKPIPRDGCKCLEDRQREHVAAVKKELGL